MPRNEISCFIQNIYKSFTILCLRIVIHLIKKVSRGWYHQKDIFFSSCWKINLLIYSTNTLMYWYLFKVKIQREKMKNQVILSIIIYWQSSSYVSVLHVDVDEIVKRFLYFMHRTYSTDTTEQQKRLWRCQNKMFRTWLVSSTLFCYLCSHRERKRLSLRRLCLISGRRSWTYAAL